MYRLITGMLVGSLFLGLGAVEAQEGSANQSASPPAIQVGARNVDDNDALHGTPLAQPDPEMTRIAVRHGLEFEVLVTDKNIAEEQIEGCWLAMTDRGIQELPERKLILKCDYYVPVFGLAIVKLRSGEYLTKNFFVNVVWRPEEESSIPNEHPFSFPEIDEPELKVLLVNWWNSVVVPNCEESWYGQYLQPEPIE